MFIDETWTKTNMTRLHGWAPKGERLVDKVPHGRWKTATFFAALRNGRIDAPCLFDGPINGDAFAPMSNSSSRRPSSRATSSSSTISAPTKERRCARRSGMSGPPRLPAEILPDLNPIEQVFANSRPCCERREREYEAISDACGEILAQYPPAECAAYLRNAGYA